MILEFVKRLSYNINKNRESDKMLELEENSKLIQELNKKLKELGESL